MLKKNKCYEAEITGYTSEGLGVARVEEMAVFVPKAIEGERCHIRILKVGKSVAYGKIEKILCSSPERVKPQCPYDGLCGGCAFQHMRYEEECRLKARRVGDALTRIGGFALGSVPLLPAETTEGYRNKAQYPVGTVEGRAEAGFYRQRSHQLIPVERCLIQPPEADAIRAAVVSWMRKYGVPAYDEGTHTGLIRHIYVRSGFRTGQILACIVANGEKLPRERALVEALRAAVPELTTVLLCIHKKPGNAVLSDHFRTLWGPGHIEDELCSLRFRLSPRSFYQVNRDQAERLYEKAIALAELDQSRTVLDLYCGTGTITLAMARQAGTAIGVEVIEAAVRDAEENAVRNGIENARFFCADAGEAAQRLAREGIKPDVIVVDPPRKGVSAAVIDAMVTMAPERIVYVSCDPATLSRDLRLLEERGYRVKTAEAVDLFPRCAHVETIALLTREFGTQ